jgi:hypothetical protein
VNILYQDAFAFSAVAGDSARLITAAQIGKVE